VKFEELIEKTGIGIVEGGPFMFEDFGPAWVLLWEDEMTAVFTMEDKEVVFVEVTDMEKSSEVHQELYMWMNPKFKDYQKKVYDQLDGQAATNQVLDVDTVFQVWHNNRKLYEDIPQEMKMEYEDDKAFHESIDRGEVPETDNDIKVH
jgi:hypothetical protein